MDTTNYYCELDTIHICYFKDHVNCSSTYILSLATITITLKTQHKLILGSIRCHLQVLTSVEVDLYLLSHYEIEV